MSLEALLNFPQSKKLDIDRAPGKGGLRLAEVN